MANNPRKKKNNRSTTLNQDVHGPVSVGKRPPLFLSLKAYQHGKKIKLELDFSPPYEMLETDLNGTGKTGFKSQSAPSFYDIEQLEGLFRYITKVIPCAIIESKFMGTCGGKLVRNEITVPPDLAPKSNKVFWNAVVSFNKTGKDKPAKEKKLTASSGGTGFLDTPISKLQISDMMQRLRVTRVHVDPDANNTLKAQSSGGDVPPPPYPPR